MHKTGNTSNKIMLRNDLESFVEKIENKLSPEGTYYIAVSSIWQDGTRWARNRITAGSDRRTFGVALHRYIDGGVGVARTDQIDDESINNMIRFVEWRARLERDDARPSDKPLEMYSFDQPSAHVWSQNTYNFDYLDESKSIHRALANSEVEGVMTAGYLGILAGAILIQSTNGRSRNSRFSAYGQATHAQFSLTVRHPDGLGSGWAGRTGYDFEKLSVDDLVVTAMDKCLKSVNPVRIEPGRYTAVLEPQAVSDIVTPLIGGERSMSRVVAEEFGSTPFVLGFDNALKLWRTKIGLKVVDERISIWHDPLDPLTGIISPYVVNHGLQAINWIKDGVLKTLSHPISYAVNRLGEIDQNGHRVSYRMSGGNASIDEMIQSTERGVLVTRFSPPSVTHNGSMMSSGLTRDGLWLIEKGRITNAIRNFRTLESPIFILNNVEQLGEPMPVFNPGVRDIYANLFIGNSPHNLLASVVVPSLKVRDFSFSSTVDAV